MLIEYLPCARFSAGTIMVKRQANCLISRSLHLIGGGAVKEEEEEGEEEEEEEIKK